MTKSMTMKLSTQTGALILALIGSSCGSPPKKVFGRLEYVLSEAGGSIGTPRSLGAGVFDGDNGVQLSCNVVESATTRVLNLSFSQPAMQTALSVSGAVFAKATTPQPAMQTSGCFVNVTEGNRFTGNCGGSDPSAATQCRIDQVTFSVDAASGDPKVEGRILCRNLTSSTAATTARKDLIHTDFNEIARGASFTLFNCTGLTP